MITVNGRFFAVVVLLAAGAFLVALGIAGGISNRVTGREVLLGLIALAFAVVAALWLRKDRKQHGGAAVKGNRNPRPGASAAGSSPSGGTAWRPDAACKDADQSLFFGEWDETPEGRLEREAEARAICARCPSRRPCLEFALALAIPWGVWGGLSEDERRGMKGLPRLPDVCGNGLHQMTPENTKHVAGTAYVRCRECQRDSDRRTRAGREARKTRTLRRQKEQVAA